MKRSISLLVVVLSLFCISTSLFAQATKAAFVDSDVILRELPEARQASQEIEVLVAAWRDSLEKMNTDLQKQIEEYQKKEAMMSAANKDAEQKRLADIRQKMQDYYNQRFDARAGEGAVARERKLAPIREKILKVIETTAKEDGFNFVFDRPNVLYADNKVDLTYKVLDRLKRGTAVKGK
ncbi:MAG: OmpH family outer membrane protein [bacterium]